MLECQQRCGLFPAQWVFAEVTIFLTELNHFVLTLPETVEQGRALVDDMNIGRKPVAADVVHAYVCAAVGHDPELDKFP